MAITFSARPHLTSMSQALLVSLGLVVLFEPSCTPANLQCGEAFCLGVRATQWNKIGAAEDFNHYTAIYGSREFSIYEGDHPKLRGMSSVKNLPPGAGFESSEMYVDQRDVSIVLQTGSTAWPAFVVVSAKRQDADGAVRIASSLKRISD